MNKSSPHLMVRLFHTRWFYIVNLLLIVVVVVSFTREIVHSHDIAMQIQTLQNQSKDLETQHLAIADLKTAVQTETYVESEARLKLGLKKPGESVIILKNEKETGSETNPDRAQTSSLSGKGQSEQMGVDNQAGLAQKPLANSTKWWYYFFNKQVYRENQ